MAPQAQCQGGSWPRTQAHAQSSGGEGGDRLWKDTTILSGPCSDHSDHSDHSPYLILLFNYV